MMESRSLGQTRLRNLALPRRRPWPLLHFSPMRSLFCPRQNTNTRFLGRRDALRPSPVGSSPSAPARKHVYAACATMSASIERTTLARQVPARPIWQRTLSAVASQRCTFCAGHPHTDRNQRNPRTSQALTSPTVTRPGQPIASASHPRSSRTNLLASRSPIHAFMSHTPGSPLPPTRQPTPSSPRRGHRKTCSVPAQSAHSLGHADSVALPSSRRPSARVRSAADVYVYVDKPAF
ncbi:hypothetical protein L227DRAFT_20625 [Lentinus tigrinus ALCF2SS1-6]|uniref:Uncharacterized protein n=1 Tax=Lentinus tigrinus ALCF2SS1-6 TaxID=1328759 RepID=A0A5C2STU2_9APHY|nr:hypothetical protein L227DRAFT_20625 [Lentinus tigrinus ALCF2SS1-6]